MSNEKELFDAKLSGLQALIQANFDLVHRELKHINDNSADLKLRVDRLENNSDPCPSGIKIQKRVNELEKWRWKSVGYVSGAGLIIGIIFKYLV